MAHRHAEREAAPVRALDDGDQRALLGAALVREDLSGCGCSRISRWKGVNITKESK